MSTFVVRKHRRLWGTRYTFQLMADNGEPITGPSEPYTTADKALNGIARVKALAADAAIDRADLRAAKLK